MQVLSPLLVKVMADGEIDLLPALAWRNPSKRLLPQKPVQASRAAIRRSRTLNLFIQLS